MLSTFVRKLVKHARPRKPDNRRESRRHTPGQPAPCVLILRDGTRLPARLHNLSFRGAGLLVDRPFPPGTDLLLLLVNAGHTYALSVAFTVVRCGPPGPKGCMLGGRFDRPVRIEELTPFLV